MKCPRCSLFDIPQGAPACAVCGYLVPGITAETAVARTPPTPPDPSTAQPSPAPAITELDARRELAREFRIEALLPSGDETTTAVYLAYDPRQDRQVEVKATPRQPLRDAGVEDRFRRAVEAAAALAYECLSGTRPAGAAPAKLSEVRPEIPPHVSDALRQGLSKRPADQFPSVLDLVAAVGGTSPGAGGGARRAMFSLNPRRGPGSPVVIMDDEP